MQKPILLKNFLSDLILEKIKNRIEGIKNNSELFEDNQLFHRKMIINDSYLSVIHNSIFHKAVSEKTGLDIKPTYNFVSSYLPGKGICPIHIDRGLCFITLGICIDQKKTWPLYVNSNHYESLSNMEVSELEKIQQESLEFLLEPGDAVIFYGMSQPHWRNQLSADNFCDLAFFHYVKSE